MERGNESTKLCCQHPWGQQGALSELTWAAELPLFSFILSSPLFYFSFCISLPSIWQVPLLPLPLPCYTLLKWPLSHTHKPTLACTSIPHPLSHVLFTVRLRPTALQDERPPPPLCLVPRCCSSSNWKTTRVITTSVANVARKLREHFYSTGVGVREERDGV